eukprot:GILJ01007909.1.p1 GENE.GILJ01007909.1~~GILJ01007909.1.p1  ORF type:complete len:722 (+),score=70.35 GILJ01007909.1:25-2190(+)
MGSKLRKSKMPKRKVEEAFHDMPKPKDASSAVWDHFKLKKKITTVTTVETKRVAIQRSTTSSETAASSGESSSNTLESHDTEEAYSTQEELVTVCIHCEKSYTYGGSTGNMNKHLANKHAKIFFGAKRAETAERRQTQQTLTAMAEKHSKKRYTAKEMKAIHHDLLCYIVGDLKPLNLPESKRFRRFCATLNSKYVPPAYSTIRSMLREAFQYTKSVLLPSFLSTAKYVSFTTDLWTALDHKGQFLSVTLHWLTPEFEMRDIELIAKLPYPHTANHVADKLEQIINDDYECGQKIVAAASDNAASMISALEKFDIIRVPCVVHTMNLIAKSILKVPGMIELEQRVRALTNFIRESDKRRQLFRECQLLLGMKTAKDLISDSPTRFNSFYLLLSRLLEVKDTFGVMKLRLISMRDTSLNEADTHLCKAAEARAWLHELERVELSETEWSIAVQVRRLLEPVCDTSTYLGASKYPTLSAVLPALHSLKEYISEMAIGHPTVVEVRDAILTSLANRWDSLAVAALRPSVLDPRFKDLDFIESARSRTQAEDSIQSEYNRRKERDAQRLRTVNGQDGRPPENAANDDPVNDDTDERANKRSAQSQEPTTFSLFQRRERRNAPVLIGNRDPNDEWAAYKLIHPVTHTTDVLRWWRERKHVFPILSDLALKYLAVPASAVPSERLFSAAGNLITKKRTKLAPDTVEEELFLRSCIRYDEFSSILDLE